MEQMLSNMPNTEQAWAYACFQYFFFKSAPYISLVPTGGNDKELPYGDSTEQAYNKALVSLREAVTSAFNDYTEDVIDLGDRDNAEQIHQLPFSSESRR